MAMGSVGAAAMGSVGAASGARRCAAVCRRPLRSQGHGGRRRPLRLGGAVLNEEAAVLDEEPSVLGVRRGGGVVRVLVRARRGGRREEEVTVV